MQIVVILSRPHFFTHVIITIIQTRCIYTETTCVSDLSIDLVAYNLHRLISAAIGRWVTSDPAELPFLPGRKKLWTSAVEYNPYVTKGKTQVSPRFIIKIQHIYVFHMYDC